MVKEIITDVEKLSDRADEIDTRKENALMRSIILDLKDTIRAKKLSSLSAPQLGYNKRIFCISYGDKGIISYVNPVISGVKGLELSKEDCSSIPNKKYIRIRNNDINIMYQDPLGKVRSNRMIGLAAIIFQHEMDHLDGLLISDIGLEIDDDFENASEEERQEVIKMYLDSIDVKAKDAKELVNKNKEAKQISDAIDFIESVNKGETKLGKGVKIDGKKQ